MHLPSFLWLWRIAAWAMGLSLLAYAIQLLTGLLFRSVMSTRAGEARSPEALTGLSAQLRSIHWLSGWILVGLVLLLLAIGVVGTLGEFGTLGQSVHLFAGLSVTALVLASAGSSLLIPHWPWARRIHLTVNFVLLLALVWVSCTGWSVVQKYLP